MELAIDIADNIEEDIIELDIIPTVETIQDMVEEYLMNSERKDVARAYILYRNERAKFRETPTWEMDELQEAIWENKYRYNNETFEEFLNRVSNNDKEIKKLIIDKRFTPAGRILAGRGTYKDGNKVTLSNCYVIRSPEDNIESIFDTAKEMAKTYSWGGGCGVDISKLRPNNAKVNNAARTTTGAISFMELYSMVTGLIGQKNRRGALMISIDCNHPDLIDFINIKSNLNKVTKANISIRITDDFMKAIQNNEVWEMKFTVKDTGEIITRYKKATEIFNLICKMNWNYAEPGNLYWGRIEEWNLLSEDKEFKYSSVNPCAEEPLIENGSCNLCSINLSRFVLYPFTNEAKFDYNKFDYTVRKAVDYMNDILDESIENNLYPLEEQRQMVINWRQIGIGIMGLADMLIKMGIKYGDKESLKLCDKIGFEMINSALQQSAILAKEKGTYKEYKRDFILKSEFLKYNAYPKTLELIKNFGLRNSQILSIAPTGSISTMWGVSGGIEPIYNYYFIRKTESLHDEDAYYKIFTPIVREYMEKFNIKNEDELPIFFTNAMLLNFYERIDMQSVWQKHIDASISSTVNLPYITSVKQIEDLYIYAWEQKLKGITIFRDGCKRIGILTSEDNFQKYEKANGLCEDCGSDNLIKEGGCTLCLDCGWSPCSV